MFIKLNSIVSTHGWQKLFLQKDFCVSQVFLVPFCNFLDMRFLIYITQFRHTVTEVNKVCSILNLVWLNLVCQSQTFGSSTFQCQTLQNCVQWFSTFPTLTQVFFFLQEGFAPPEDDEIDEGARGDQEEFWTPPLLFITISLFLFHLSPFNLSDHYYHQSPSVSTFILLFTI